MNRPSWCARRPWTYTRSMKGSGHGSWLGGRDGRINNFYPEGLLKIPGIGLVRLGSKWPPLQVGTAKAARRLVT